MRQTGLEKKYNLNLSNANISDGLNIKCVNLIQLKSLYNLIPSQAKKLLISSTLIHKCVFWNFVNLFGTFIAHAPLLTYNLRLHKFWVRRGQFPGCPRRVKRTEGLEASGAAFIYARRADARWHQARDALGAKYENEAARAEASQTGLWINIGSQKRSTHIQLYNIYYYVCLALGRSVWMRKGCTAERHLIQQSKTFAPAVLSAEGIYIKARPATFNALALQRKKIYKRIYIYMDAGRCGCTAKCTF